MENVMWQPRKVSRLRNNAQSRTACSNTKLRIMIFTLYIQIYHDNVIKMMNDATRVLSDYNDDMG